MIGQIEAEADPAEVQQVAVLDAVAGAVDGLVVDPGAADGVVVVDGEAPVFGLADAGVQAGDRSIFQQDGRLFGVGSGLVRRGFRR